MKASWVIPLAMGAALLAPQVAYSSPACLYDQLTSAAERQGRNAWAEQWDYLKPGQAATLNATGDYIEFSNGCYRGGPWNGPYTTCPTVVPIAETAPNRPGLIAMTFCHWDCYTPDQRMLSNGSYSTMENIAQSKRGTVSSAHRSSSGQISYVEQPVASFRTGQVIGQILFLEGVGGQRLTVTPSHPLVLANGNMVPAGSLQAGDFLLDSRGEPINLARITTRMYEGSVWNVEPVSEEKSDNVLVAEGFLAGSVKFQEKWANDRFRLFVRDRVDVDAILGAKSTP